MQRKMFGGHDVADKVIEYQLLRRNQTDATKSTFIRQHHFRRWKLQLWRNRSNPYQEICQT